MNIKPLVFLLFLLLPAYVHAGNHDISFPQDEINRAKDAIEDIRKDRPENAIAVATKIKHPDIKRVLEWAIYKSPGSPVSAHAIKAFAASNPDFPEQQSLYNQAEAMAIEHLQEKPKELIAFFKEHPPYGALAHWKLADAYFTTNQQKTKATELLKTAFHSAELLAADANDILTKYRSVLSQEDMEKRVDHLLWENQLTAAKDIIARTSGEKQKLYHARITLQESGYGVDKAVAAVPSSLKNDPGLIYDRARWRERKGYDKGAMELVLTLSDTGSSEHAAKWWKMRHRLAREALESKQYQTAYNIASHHHGKPGSIDFAESEWLSGWIATRFLRDPRKGYEHFYQMYQHVSFPISLARAAYWSARTAQKNGNKDIADKWYRLAAKHPFTFYGQLATLALDKKPQLTLPAFPTITAIDQQDYDHSSMVKAIHALIQMDELQLAKEFIDHAIETNPSAGLRALISQIGGHYKHTHLSVYAARTANQYGTALLQTGYPVYPVDYTIYSSRALAHAITLQESRFKNDAASHAGAQGLMQLMPATARRMARMLHENYRRSKLVYDPEFNVRLGSYYLKHLLDNYDGNHILAIASYNAGPGNARKWVERFGDPRQFDTIDQVIDWMEMIPFGETRNYVQRVMENMQIYRAIGGETSLMMKKDLISNR